MKSTSCITCLLVLPCLALGQVTIDLGALPRTMERP